MKKLFGVTTAMVTPLTEQGAPDIEAIQELTEFLIKKEVNCLYPLGTTGEMFRLTNDERKLVAKTVVEQAAGRCTVFIHTGSMRQSDTIELAQHAKEIGADGVGVVSPAFFGANDREMTEYYVSVANSLPKDFPLYLYNIPQCAANDIKANVAQEIAKRCENVIGIKYSYADMIRTYEYLHINGGNFSVMQGQDKLFLPALAMGCDGTVSGNSCVYPEPFVAVYKAYCAGDIAEARRMQDICFGYCDVLKCGGNMAYFKQALHMRGLRFGHMKAPQLDLTATEIAALKADLASLPVQY